MLNKAIQPIIELIRKFIEERNWKQYHKPKDLAEAISIESGELLEKFLWKSNDEVQTMLANPEKKQEVKEEMADIFAYAFMLADSLEIDIEAAVKEKYKKNALKYPVEKVKGKSLKYNEY